jgi:hypothetical protein
MARSAVGRQSYFKIQLLAMAMFERYGRAIVRSEDKTVCSEYAAWVLQGIIDLRDRRRDKFDAVNPNSAWHRLCEELAGLGAHTRRGRADKPSAEPQPWPPDESGPVLGIGAAVQEALQGVGQAAHVLSPAGG